MPARILPAVAATETAAEESRAASRSFASVISSKRGRGEVCVVAGVGGRRSCCQLLLLFLLLLTATCKRLCRCRCAAASLLLSLTTLNTSILTAAAVAAIAAAAAAVAIVAYKLCEYEK